MISQIFFIKEQLVLYAIYIALIIENMCTNFDEPGLLSTVFYLTDGGTDTLYYTLTWHIYNRCIKTTVLPSKRLCFSIKKLCSCKNLKPIFNHSLQLNQMIWSLGHDSPSGHKQLFAMHELLISLCYKSMAYRKNNGIEGQTRLTWWALCTPKSNIDHVKFPW